MANLRGGKRIKIDNRRKQRPRAKPKNENAYQSCKMAIKKFSKDPSRKNYQGYQQALNDLFGVNPTMALAFKKQFGQILFNKALKEKDFQ